MKIAVFHNLPSGGAKRALYNNVEFLARDHEVDVYVPSIANEDYLSLNDIAHNFKTFQVKNTLVGFLYSAVKYFPSKISIRDLEKTQKNMAEVVNKKDYDVVLCEQDKYTMSPFFLKYIKKPHVYYCQQPILSQNRISQTLYEKAGLKTTNDSESFRLKFYGSRMINMDQKLASYSGYTVVNSYFSHESILRSYGVNSFVSYLGVNTGLFKPQDVPKENFVLSVGRCIPEKGFEFILKSLGKIDEKTRPELVIVSDLVNTHWKNYLENLAYQIKVKLKVLVLVSDDELVQLYNKAKLVVYAPYLEPFGLVPLESMSCGTPVVGVKEGGVRESVIHQYNGILTERDEYSFSREITSLLLDDQKTEKLSDNSIKHVNEFWTLKHSGKRLMNHLNRAIDLYYKKS
jgi:glycosyltransferase involved in cell wall biosynthesis